MRCHFIKLVSADDEFPGGSLSSGTQKLQSRVWRSWESSRKARESKPDRLQPYQRWSQTFVCCDYISVFLFDKFSALYPWFRFPSVFASFTNRRQNIMIGIYTWKGGKSIHFVTHMWTAPEMPNFSARCQPSAGAGTWEFRSSRKLISHQTCREWFCKQWSPRHETHKFRF